MAISVRLDPETEERLKCLSEETGRSVSFYIRELIGLGLEDVEDYYMAEAVLKRVDSGEEKVYTLEEVKQHLGLDSKVRRSG